MYFEENDVRFLAGWEDKDAVPFIIYDGQLYFGKNGEAHYDVYEENGLWYEAKTQVKGRIWTTRKILVTWENLNSQQAKQIQNAYKSVLNIDITSYTLLADAAFFDIDDIVYAIPLKDFISQNLKESELPKVYERQEQLANMETDSEDETSRQFGWNGISGRLGKYLTTTWGDAVEHEDSPMVLSETELRTLVRKLVAERVYGSHCS